MANPDDLDSTRAVVLLVAAVIGLISVILNIIHSRAKEIETPKAKWEFYRNAVGWINTLLVVSAVPFSIIFGLRTIFFFWVPAYVVDVVLFLTSDDPRRLRLDIFKLITSTQALLFMVVLDYFQTTLSLFGALTKGLGRK